MHCPNCNAELEDFGNLKECPRCHFTTYFGIARDRFSPLSEFDENF